MKLAKKTKNITRISRKLPIESKGSLLIKSRKAEDTFKIHKKKPRGICLYRDIFNMYMTKDDINNQWTNDWEVLSHASDRHHTVLGKSRLTVVRM